MLVILLYCGILKEVKYISNVDNRRDEINMKRLNNEEWTNIFRNLQDMSEEEYYDGVIDWVEVMWLESTDEWILCYGEELFEDGFSSEREAMDRLHSLEQTLLKDL